jgi:hypothetical protein
MTMRVRLRNWKLEIRSWRYDIAKSSFQFPFSSFFVRLGAQLARLIVTAVALGTARMTFAQGCAMCYTSAESAKKAGIEALRSGILILLVPPLVMFGGIIWLTYRSRNRFNEHSSGPDEGWGENPPEVAPEPPGNFEEEPVLAGVGDPQGAEQRLRL